MVTMVPIKVLQPQPQTGIRQQLTIMELMVRIKVAQPQREMVILLQPLIMEQTVLIKVQPQLLYLKRIVFL